MSLIDNLSAFLPFRKKDSSPEYFFALNIGAERLTAALWVIEGRYLKILDSASGVYGSVDEIISVTDRLLDQILGIRDAEPQKILFGVPDAWLTDDNLKDENLKLLKDLVGELDLAPMAYVAGSHALIHFLEKEGGIPPTAVLVGFEKHHLTVTVVRAGKLDGSKTVTRGETAGADIERVLLKFTDVETLPSKILIYGLENESLEKLKSQLLSFSWMSKLSFLHFPKIEVLSEDLEIESVCLAGGSEINSGISLVKQESEKSKVKSVETQREKKREPIDEFEEAEQKARRTDKSLGFVVGDVSERVQESDEIDEVEELMSRKEPLSHDGVEEELIPVDQGRAMEIEDFEEERAVSPGHLEEKKPSFNFRRFIPGNFTHLSILLILIGIVVLVVGSYLTLAKADVKIFVEPKILEKDAQVISDPNQKEVNEETKTIPGQIVELDVSGSSKASASGKKQIGDPAKGTVILYNKTNESKSISKGASFSSSSGQKYTLDTSVNIASSSASDIGITFGKTNAHLTASVVGPDGNLPSGTELTIANTPSSQVSAKAEGNFSGGTSKDVTVVSDDDHKKLLAQLASELRKEAQQKLQEKNQGKKILEEALAENITKRSYSKKVGDQASEFSLDLSIHYKGTAFEDKDLKQIVGKLVTTDVQGGFKLDLEDTETQADVAKLEKDGKLIFLARFKAKLLPEFDIEKIKDQIKFKTPAEVSDLLKSMENILGSEIKIIPQLPGFLNRMPIIEKNINVEVGLK